MLGTVAHTCNPSYLGTGGWEDCGLKSAGGKRSQDPISTNGWAQWQVPVIPAIWGSINRRISIQVSLGIKQDTTSKITKAKGAGGVAQVVECLLQAQGLDFRSPIWTKKKRRKK
jgi:hypothetical protein